MRKRFLWFVFICILMSNSNKTNMNDWTLFIYNITALLLFDYILVEKIAKKVKMDE